jgi:hypothetical protein
VTTTEWGRRREEGLPTLLASTKHAKALNPANHHEAANTPTRIVRRFMFGSPKFRYLLIVIKNILFSEDMAENHRKLVVVFQWPRSVEMFLSKRSSSKSFSASKPKTTRSF